MKASNVGDSQNVQKPTSAPSSTPSITAPAAAEPLGSAVSLALGAALPDDADVADGAADDGLGDVLAAGVQAANARLATSPTANSLRVLTLCSSSWSR
jgi:hypothetical protein